MGCNVIDGEASVKGALPSVPKPVGMPRSPLIPGWSKTYLRSSYANNDNVNDNDKDNNNVNDNDNDNVNDL